MPPRFYTPDTIFSLGEKTFLTAKARHHAGRVLRMLEGDEATLFDGQGTSATGPIYFEGADAYIKVNRIESPRRETPVEITLVQALVSPEKTDWIIEKAVETGVARIILVPTERSIVRLTPERLQKRLIHWQDIIVSACEQCGRNVVPGVEYCTMNALNTTVRSACRYCLAPAASAPLKLSGIDSVAFFVGPEGGLSESEIEKLTAAGWVPALIGPRVLRTETAGIVAASIANVIAGDYMAQ